jgi:hypothetical protein
VNGYDDGVDAGWRSQPRAERATSKIWIAECIGSSNSVAVGHYFCDSLAMDQGGNITRDENVRGFTFRDEIKGIDPSQWHTYSLTWSDSNTIAWYIDGASVKKMATIDTVQWMNWIWPTTTIVHPVFNDYMHISIESHVGGGWNNERGMVSASGYTTPSSQFPTNMEIDYVKAWDGEHITGAKPARGAVAALPQVRLNSTWISYSHPLVIMLSRQASVSAAIYDLKGRTVYAVSSGAEGARKIEWNGLSNEGKALPGGIYVCSVSLANKSVHSRVTLMQ